MTEQPRVAKPIAPAVKPAAAPAAKPAAPAASTGQHPERPASKAEGGAFSPVPGIKDGTAKTGPYYINEWGGLKLADEVPGEPKINRLFRTVMLHEGSDLHLKAGLPGMIRLRNLIQKMNMAPISQELMEKLFHEIMDEKAHRQMKENGGADFAHVIGDDLCRFRVNMLKQRGKYSLVARRVNTSIPTFEKLGLPPSIEKLCHYRPGPDHPRRGHRLRQIDHHRLHARLHERARGAAHPHHRRPDRVRLRRTR